MIELADSAPENIPEVVDTTTQEQTSQDHFEVEDSTNNTETPTDKEPSLKKKIAQNFIQEAEIFFETTWDETAETVNLPSDLRDVSMEAVINSPNISLVKTPADRKWAETFSNGLDQSSFDDTYHSTMAKDDAEFHQGVKGSTGVLMGSLPKFKPVENETTISGERAVLRMMSYLGMGTIFQVPLWHTGIWITLKAPTEGALLELQRQIIADKISFGRQSYGLAFSNNSAYVADRLVSFALNHIYETTLQEATDLKTVIATHDIPTLLWGMACAIYPRGFQYRRCCITDPTKCNHVVEERLNLSKILWTNTRALAPSQVNHMTKRRSGTMTLDSVKRYQEELLSCQKRQVIVNEKSSSPISLILRVPKASEYIDSGSRWIGDIVSMVNKSLGMEATDADRNDYILKQGQASAMRQYLHWVESIEYMGSTIEDRETLEDIFNVISADDIIRNDFMKKVHDYIDDSTIAIIGIPVYDCPVCGEEQKSPLPKQTSIIPIDVYQTFFTLLVQKLQKLRDR